MSDADLRALERRFRETGDLDDEVAWLKGRLRADQLSQEQLNLAAYLGSPAAQRAGGIPSEPTGVHPSTREIEIPAEKRALCDWVAGLAKWTTHPLVTRDDPSTNTFEHEGIRGFGREVFIRAALAATRTLLPHWIDDGAFPQLERMIHAVEAFLHNPGLETWRGAAGLVNEADTRVNELREGQASQLMQSVATTALVHCTYERMHPRRIELLLSTFLPSGNVYWRMAKPYWLGPAAPACVAAGTLSGLDTVRAAIRAELVPWALTGDSLRHSSPGFVSIDDWEEGRAPS